MDQDSDQKFGSGRSEPSAPPYCPPQYSPPRSTSTESSNQQRQYTTTTSSSSTTNIHIELNTVPPPPAGTVVGVPPPGTFVGSTTSVIIVEKERWTCCGMGFGWFLFAIGWLLCGIPWFAGVFVLLCGRYDRRERAGLLACATFAIVVSVVAIIQAIKGDHK